MAEQNNEIEFLNVGLNPEEMSLSLEGETILSGERTDVHFIWDSWDYDKLKPNTCGKITYTKNWLGEILSCLLKETSAHVSLS
ncbi:MAG: hypothetical protein R2883_03050 [Caldisericia bacterium]